MCKIKDNYMCNFAELFIIFVKLKGFWPKT